MIGWLLEVLMWKPEQGRHPHDPETTMDLIGHSEDTMTSIQEFNALGVERRYDIFDTRGMREPYRSDVQEPMRRLIEDQKRHGYVMVDMNRDYSTWVKRPQGDPK